MNLKNLKIPIHIGFIMDGNGRWAKQRGLSRIEGHKAGVDALKRVLKRCKEVGVKIVSIFAFSTENFQRPKAEVDGIFKLINKLFDSDLNEFINNDVKLVHMGSTKGISKDLKQKIEKAIAATKDCKSMIFNIGFNYGGRLDIVDAVNKLLKEKKTEVTEADISNKLYTAGLPDPDIIARTSGELRISNFMLWQMAYSEFYFANVLWPDMNEKEVDKIIESFNQRQRRFGKLI